MQPTKAHGFWKYETDSLRLFQPGAEIIYDYDTDSRVGITGTQNRIILRGPKFQTQGERVNVIFPGSDINDNRESIQWVPTKSITTIDDPGGIDANDTSVIVNKPANADQFTPDNLRAAAVKIDDEYVVIESIALSVPDGSHDTWTIKRGRHGTTAASHGDGDTCRLYRTFPDMGMIALTSSNVALDVPTALSATAFAGYIDVSWTHGLTDAQIKQLHSFILYYSDTTIGVFDPNVDALPGGVTRLELNKSPRHVFPDSTYVEKFFKVTSMNLSGVESALSAEDSATATQPPLPVVNAKPDPPTIGMVGDGGNQESGYLFFLSVQVSGSAGDAGVVKLEYQIGDHDASFTAAGDPPTGGFTPISTNRIGGDIYELQAGKEWAGLTAVPNSSAAQGGKYQLTARVFNGSGGGWSDWATPVTASTVVGIPDLGAPGTTDAIFRVINTPETDGGGGNNVTFEIGLPSANGKTIYGYEIQGVLNAADWTADLPGNLGVLDNLAAGTGDIVDGGIIISNVSPALGAGAHVDDVIVVYGTADISGAGEGELTGLVGNNLITANTTTTVTVKPHGGVGYKKTKTGMKFVIASDQDWFDFRVESNLPQFGGIAERVGDLYRVAYEVSGVFKYRIRFFGPETRSAWWYHETGTDGTATKASADFFTPSKLVGSAAIAPLTVTGAEVAAFTLDLDDKSVSNSLSALILAHASKPPTVASGVPSGAPGANEGDFYLRSDTTPTTMYYWTGAVWTTDRSLWPVAAQAEAYQVVGHLTAGAITSGAMVVTGILDATHIVAAGLDLAAGQDFQLYLADSNPSEIRFGTDGGGQFGGHIFAQATGANTYFSPQVNGSGFLNLGGTSSHFGEEMWDQIALNAKAVGSGIVTLNATDSTSGFVKQLLMNTTGVFLGFYDAGSLFTGCEYTDDSAVFKADNVTVATWTSTGSVFTQDAEFQGDVGIGTAAPDADLEVGDANPTRIFTTYPGNILSGGGTTGRLHLEGSSQADIMLDDSGGAVDEKLGPKQVHQY